MGEISFLGDFVAKEVTMYPFFGKFQKSVTSFNFENHRQSALKVRCLIFVTDVPTFSEI